MTKCISCIHSSVCKYKESIENMDKILSEFIEKDYKALSVKDVISIETGCKNYSCYSITSITGTTITPLVQQHYDSAKSAHVANTCHDNVDSCMTMAYAEDTTTNAMLFGRRNVNA